VSTTSTGSSSRRSPVPARPDEIAAALRALGVRPDRGLGQSFLCDPFIADAEAALVGTAPGEPVLEIGGGLGALTEALLRRGIGPLTVLERDRRLAAHLRRTFGEEAKVLEGDARTFPVPGRFRAVVGNLPYSTATPILLRLFEARVPRVVAMVQSEVADRLCAGPGSKAFGRLTFAAVLYGTVEPFQPVGPGSFFPSPKVGSRIIVFTGRPGALPVRSVQVFERVVRMLFSSRRKQLGNLLPRLTDEPDALAEAAGWPDDWARRRPEELDVASFFRLADALAARSGRTQGPG
jgi:16S rRNA (adenine1518-N6/adenine1519-N6)-dimethyltransferase